MIAIEPASTGRKHMASANILEFGAANWQTEVVGAGMPVLVDFWAPWCGPCRALTPTIERIAELFAGKVKVGKVNTDEEPDLAAQYAISFIPRLLIFKGSDQPLMSLGGTSEAELTKLLNKVVAG
jgi:thioredoxin